MERLIEGVALVEGGARREQLEFPGGGLPRPAPPGPPRPRFWGESVARIAASRLRQTVGCWKELLELVQGWPEAKLGLGVKPGVNNTRQTTEHTQTRLPEILIRVPIAAIRSLRVIVTRLSLCSSLGICDWGRCTWPAKIRRLDAVSSSAGLGPH